MWARIQYDRWNEEVEQQKLNAELREVQERKKEEMKNNQEDPTQTETEVTKEREALREDYEALFVVAKTTH